MTPAVDLDRLLGSVLDERGPQDLPAGFVDDVLASVTEIGQRRVRSLIDRRAWPTRYPPRMTWPVRFAAVGLAALLLVAMLAALFAGTRQVRPNRHDILGSLDGVLEPIGLSNVAREDPALVPLADGRILIVGGAGPGQPAELLDPNTGMTAPVGTDEPDGPTSAVRMNDDRVLVFGWTYGEPAATGRPDVRVFDPKTNTFSPAGPMAAPRFEPAVLLLADGRVLISGGLTNQEAGPVLTAELFDPMTNTFTPSGWDGAWRFEAANIQLEDGRILTAGGCDLHGDPASLTCTYSKALATLDPITGRWSPAGSMSHTHIRTRAVRLDDGRVLLFAGGERPDVMHFGKHGIEPVAVDIFDPRTNSVAPGFPLPHSISIAEPLTDGRLFIAGHWDVLKCVLAGSCEGLDDTELNMRVEDWWIGLYDARTGETITSPDPLGGGSPLIPDTHVPHTNAAVTADDHVVMVSGRDFEVFH